MSRIPAHAALRLLRPHQWVKNLFVAAPLVFSKHLLEGPYVGATALAVLAFCALSGAVYAFNDVRDVEADRAHPLKRHRPVAAGEVSRAAAMALAAGLAAGALALAAAVAPMLAAWSAAYLAINLSYSLGLKQVAFVDVALIAAGFLLRVAAGAAAIAVPASGWLLLCTGLLAAFLGLGKRAAELAAATRGGRDARATRAALAGYRAPVVTGAMVLLGLATVGAYVAYTRAPHTVAFFGTAHLAWTAPCCALGVARFAQLALRPRGDESPTEAMLRDAPFLINLAAWAGAVLFIIYGMG